MRKAGRSTQTVTLGPQYSNTTDQDAPLSADRHSDNTPKPARTAGKAFQPSRTAAGAKVVGASKTPSATVSRDRQTNSHHNRVAGGSSRGASARADTKPSPQSGDTSARDPANEPDTRASSKRTRTADSSFLYAGLDWEYCGLRPARLGPAVLPPEPSEEDQLFLSADTFDYDQELDLLWLTGDVRAAQGSRRVGADRVVYDRNSADLVAKGNVLLANPGVRIVAEEAQLNLDSDSGNLLGAQYRLTGKINARGTASQADMVQPTLTRYQNIVYTTCRPNQNAWSLDAADLEVNQATGWGVAHDAKLRVRGVPVFYTPYVSFPIDDRRKSGVLVPTVGTSEANGIDVTVPYYWNIAPNMDATFYPRYMSKRGPMLGAEFRHLSSRQKVELYGEVVPEDREFDDGARRWGFQVEQTGRFGQRWRSAINYNAVSDDEYLEDFGNRLEVTSTRNIERRGDLTYSGDGWYLRGRLQDFQTVDPDLPRASRPYGRLPQLLFAMTPYDLPAGIELGLGAEYDYFEHDVKVDGNRATMQPYARWPLRKSYGHLIPQVNLYLAGYDLQNQTQGKDERPSYAIPSFNLDAELVFERSIKWLNQAALQTLEPRLFYLYTPFEDQDDIPVFDSSELSISYYSLFSPNRFTGWDRIGDANQLTIGLTSRTLSKESGLELLRASVGQILYFRDRDVQISGGPEDASRSPIAGVLSAGFTRNWSGRASFVYDADAETDRSLKRAVELHYESANNRLLNLAYRYDLGTSEATRYEDTDLSFRLPVNPRLQLVGRWNYSLLHDQTVEAFAGVEYGQCCWRMRLVGQHLKNKADSSGSNTFMLQIELAGLGAIGQEVDKFLERGIYGYEAF